MAKKSSDSVLDAAIDYVINNATTMHLCAGEPADYADVSSHSLGSVSVASGDFTKGNGSVSGRRADVAAKNGVSVSTSGSCDHIALVSGTELLYVTTTSATSLTSGGTADIGTWGFEFADPS
jgi:hypothetical protein